MQPPQSHLGRRIGGAVVVLVVLWFAWGMYSRANFKARQLQAPATLGAYVTVTSAQLSAMELAVGSELRATKQVDHVAVATYGSASEPRFILAAASGRIKAEPDMLKKEAAGISAFQLSPTISEEQSVTIDGAAVRCITVDGRSRPDLAPLSWSSVVVCVHSAKGLVIEGFGMDISVSEASSLMAEAVVTL